MMSYNKDYNDLDMKHHVYINVNITSCRFIVTNDEFHQKDYKDLVMKHHVHINDNITSFRLVVTNDALLLKDYKNLDMKLRVDINVNIIMGQRTSNFDNLVQNPAYCYWGPCKI